MTPFDWYEAAKLAATTSIGVAVMVLGCWLTSRWLP
jgi:hypothetical protein